MKKSIIKLLSTLSVLMFVAIMFSMVTVAWFSMNNEVKSEGMKMDLKATPQLIISDDSSNLKAATESILESRTATTNNKSTTYFSVNWNKTTTSLECVTHDWSVGTTTGLKYNTNATAVSRTTGKASGSTALTFADAVNGDKTYYVDYVVYVAALNDSMTGNLTATFSTTATLSNAYKSASIDFYVGDTVSDSTYKGTLNLAGYSNSGTATTAVTSKVLASSVPVVTGTPLKVTLRCYFDGALIDRADTTKTYVRSKDMATTTNFTFSVNFALATVSE